MKTHNEIDSYPYLQVIVLFAGLGSVIGGVLLESIVLLMFGVDEVVRIGYEPLLYGTAIGFLPALLTGMVVAYRQIWRTKWRGFRATFLIGVVVSALYVALIAGFIGAFSSMAMIGIALVVIGSVGIFGGCCALITSAVALPKPI